MEYHSIRYRFFSTIGIGIGPSIKNRAVCSKPTFVIGTIAQLACTVWQVARTAGVHRAAVQTSVPLQKGR